MINYMKSEYYRLLRKKGAYVTGLICYLLIVAAAFILNFFGKTDPNFPYATSKFFYSNAISGGLLIVIVGLIFNSALTGKDTSLIKQSVSFGISRKIIFWSKLILTLSYFLLICVVGIILMIVLGENLLKSENQSVSNFIIACVNMAPIVLSGVFLAHTLKMLKVGEAYITIALIFIFGLSGNLLRVFRQIPSLKELHNYAPNTLFNDNLMSFLNEGAQFGLEYWIVGIIISGIALLIGAKRFKNQNID